MTNYLKPKVSPRDTYVAAELLKIQLEKLAGAPEARQENTLEDAAYRLGQAVGAEHIGRPEVERALFKQALAVHLMERRALTLIAHGLTAGLAHPRGVLDGEAGDD